MESIFEEIARKYGVSADEVKKDMQEAITQAWTDPDRTKEEAMYQKEVQSNGEIPTPEELILYVEKKLKKC